MFSLSRMKSARGALSWQCSKFKSKNVPLDSASIYTYQNYIRENRKPSFGFDQVYVDYSYFIELQAFWS